MHKSQQRLNTSWTAQQSVCVSVSSWVYIIMVRLKHHDIMLCLSQLTIHFGTQRTPEGPRINMQTHISILIYRRPTSCFKTPTVIVMHAALCPMWSYLWDLSGEGRGSCGNLQLVSCPALQANRQQYKGCENAVKHEAFSYRACYFTDFLVNAPYRSIAVIIIGFCPCFPINNAMIELSGGFEGYLIKLRWLD